MTAAHPEGRDGPAVEMATPEPTPVGEGAADDAATEAAGELYAEARPSGAMDSAGEAQPSGAMDGAAREAPATSGSAGEAQPSGAMDSADAALAEAAAVVEADLATILAERDDYLDALRRVQADFENFKKQTIRRNSEIIEHAARGLAEKLLPALDAFEGAMAHGADDVKPVYDVLMDSLEKEGLALVYPLGEAFDPNTMEAVARDDSASGTEGGEPAVTEVLRAGYLWKGRVMRPAMVKVTG